MENIKTCELCLEQIIKPEEFENVNCDEKENLQILQNLEITVSKDAKICSNCVNISHLTYNFKTSCLTNNDHLKTLIHPGVNDKLILEEVLVEKSKSEFKNEKVCRFCLNFSDVNSLVEVNLQQDVVLKDMLERCLPEIDTKFVQNPLICYICNQMLEKLYNFISQCEDTEVFRKLDQKTDVLVNENTSTLAVENNDKSMNVSFVKEENYDGIENPELQIKSEDFDINEDIKDSIEESDSVEEKDVKTKPLGTINKKKFACDICSYQTNINNHLKQHYLIHKESSNVNVFKCDYCPFATKWRYSLNSHTVLHKEVNVFKCDYCSFATNWKSSLTMHKLLHKNPLELPKFKCNDCPYETIYRHCLARHVFVHKNQSEVNINQNVEENDVKPDQGGTIKEKKFVCDICSYQTNKKEDLKSHCLIHKEPSEVNLFKCDYCPFATKWKNSLIGHRIRHETSSELPKSKCDYCPYETNRKSSLVRHVLLHKNPSQVNMYKSKVYPFQVKNKHCSMEHKKTRQVEIYSCDKCNYKSQFKSSIARHLRYHKESKQPAKSSQNLKEVRIYKCNECSYVGTRNWHLIQHQLLHKDLSEREIYNCTECSFQAPSKIALQRHCKKNHSDLEVPFGEQRTSM